MSMIDVVPTLLEFADVPKSDYYEYIYNMHKSIPIVTADGTCYKNSAEPIDMSQSDELAELLRGYYYLEYNNAADADRIERLYK